MALMVRIGDDAALFAWQAPLKRCTAASALHQASTDAVDYALPVVSVDGFIADPSSRESEEECARVADALHRFGIIIVRDARVTEADNQRCVTVYTMFAKWLTAAFSCRRVATEALRPRC